VFFQRLNATTLAARMNIEVALPAVWAHTGPMSRVTDDHLRTLRQRYNAAYTAHQSCVRAMSEAAVTGESPCETLLANEARALQGLGLERAKLLAAIGRHAADD
jgi:hypothetical protein